MFICGFDRPNITYHVHNKVDEKKQLLKFIEKKHDNCTGIVYCLSRKKTEEIANFLHSEGYNAHPFHAKLPQKRKDETLKLYSNIKKAEKKINWRPKILFKKGLKSTIKFYNEQAI